MVDVDVDVDEQGAPLVFIGAITIDSIAAVPGYPGPDQRVLAVASVRAGGGPAATAAVTAARLGARDVRFIGVVGDDADGEGVCAELAGEGVDVTAVARISGAPTGSSVIVVDVERGTRAICATPGPPLVLDPSTAQGRAGIEALHGARCIHVDHLGWAALTSVVDVRESGGRPPVSADVSYDAPGFTPHGVDLYVPSMDEAADPDLFLHSALAQGARCVVATRGAQGSVAACADGPRLSAAGITTDIVSTLGAGDVFHGALLAALDRGLDLHQALSFSNAIAALSCRSLDGRSAIPHLPAHLDSAALARAATALAATPALTTT